ncbi:MAG: hypothetical protein V4608_13070 [Bacteroidota bacterium]
MKLLYSSTLIVIILFFISCKKKDTDELGPIISISSPLQNQFFNVFGVIPVKASITDETKITSVSISLVNDQYSPVSPSLSVSVQSPSMEINTSYYIDNIHLENGIYYLMIVASDGINESRTYQKVSIGAVSKVLKQIFVVSYSSTSQTNLSYIDSAFTSIIPYHSFSGDYIGSSVSSYFQQAYRCGEYTGNFEGIILEYNSQKFSIASQISSNPYFTGFYSDDKKNYVARYSGHIIGYDYTGASVYTAIASAGFYATAMCFNTNYLITSEKDKTSSAKKLVTHYPTGVAEKQCTITQEVVEFCEMDNDHVFIFGNISGQGVIQLFDRTNNNLWNPYPSSLSAGTILSAVKIDEDTYLFGHSNGTIYKYRYQTSSVTTYLTGYAAKQIKYDELNNQLVIAEASKISVFDYPTTTLIKAVNSSETILDVHLLYNR